MQFSTSLCKYKLCQLKYVKAGIMSTPELLPCTLINQRQTSIVSKIELKSAETGYEMNLKISQNKGHIKDKIKLILLGWSLRHSSTNNPSLGCKLVIWEQCTLLQISRSCPDLIIISKWDSLWSDHATTLLLLCSWTSEIVNASDDRKPIFSTNYAPKRNQLINGLGKSLAPRLQKYWMRTGW